MSDPTIIGGMSIIPAHCVQCGHETRLIPRPEPCPDCGSSYPWGSTYAPYPTGEQRKNALKAWATTKEPDRG